MSNAYRDWQSDEIHELTQQLGDKEQQLMDARSELEDAKETITALDLRVQDLEASLVYRQAVVQEVTEELGRVMEIAVANRKRRNT